MRRARMRAMSDGVVATEPPGGEQGGAWSSNIQFINILILCFGPFLVHKRFKVVNSCT